MKVALTGFADGIIMAITIKIKDRKVTRAIIKGQKVGGSKD